MSNNPSIVDKDHPPAYPAGVRWDVEIPSMTLNEMVDEAIAEYGNKSALDFLGKKLSFNELDGLIDRAAKGFQDIGVKKGDRVGVFMPNSTYHFIMFFGALRAGAVVVPFLSTYNEEQVLQQIQDSGAKVMVTMDLEKVKANPVSGKQEVTSFYPSLERLLKRGDLPDDFKVVNCRMQDILPFPKNLLYPLAKRKQVTHVDRAHPDVRGHVVDYKVFMDNDGNYRPVDVRPDDLALLQYTNGTSSGKPKGVQLTHGNITANVLQTEEYMVAASGKEDIDGYVKRGEERILGILPYFHVYGMNVLMMFSMRTGAEVLILPDPKDLKEIVHTVKKKHPTIAPFVPKHYQAFVERLKPEDLEYFSDIKVFMSGSEKLKLPVRAAFEQAVNCSILEGYGSSEGAPVFTAQTPGKATPAGSVGFPLPGIEMKIIPECSPNEMPQNWEPVEIGVKGEICVRGQNIMPGYWNRPEATALALKDAWYRTGDLGVLSAEGYLTITGRSKDIIIVNGENVACAAIEDHFMEIDGVAECNAVEVADPRSGEAAVLYIRFKPGQGLTEADLRAYLSKQDVPALESPKYIVIWPEDKELPAIGVGKPDKNTLRKLAAEQFGPKKGGPAPGV